MFLNLKQNVSTLRVNNWSLISQVRFVTHEHVVVPGLYHDIARIVTVTCFGSLRSVEGIVGFSRGQIQLVYGSNWSYFVNLWERRKDIFYLTKHSTHFIYGYMAKDHSDGERGNPLPPHRLLFVINSKEGNVSFNDALNTFYLRLYGVGHMVNDHSDSERGNPLPPHGLLFPINSKGSFICTIPQTE